MNVFSFIISGGPDRGVCNCGQCVCSEKWSGVNCGCSTELATCIDPANGKVCNDRGPCECGLCRCNSTEYSGPYCDDCPSCDGQCPVLTKAVESQIAMDKAEISGPNYVSYLRDNITAHPEDKVCKYIGADDCVYVFKYRHDFSSKRNSSAVKFVIEASRVKSCKQPIDIAFYSVRFTGIFILVGVFTLMAWRIFTFCIDRHEYRKFIKTCKNVNFPEVNADSSHEPFRLVLNLCHEMVILFVSLLRTKILSTSHQPPLSRIQHFQTNMRCIKQHD